MSLFRSKAAWGLGLFLLVAVVAWRFSDEPSQRISNLCDNPVAGPSIVASSWSMGQKNHRYQENTKINSSNIENLKLAWVFAIDDELSPHSAPLVTSDSVIIGGFSGTVTALDKQTGCTRWEFVAGGDVRTGIVGGEPDVIHFGTFEGLVYALKLSTGELLWTAKADDHRFAMVTGTPKYYDGVLYVPKSSFEMYVATVPFYNCCTFRGGITALNAKTGELLWEAFTIEEPSSKVRSRWGFFADKGPSGAPIWSAPLIDETNGLVIVGTGENYTEPTTDTSDAIMAFDLKTGERRWYEQFTENDAWNVACEMIITTNCPDANGPDFDFGGAPLLMESPQGPLVIAGQKSGMVYAIKAATGERVWQRRAASGGKLGGIHWGIAADPERNIVYVPGSDRDGGWIKNHSSVGDSKEGLSALDAHTGELLWYTPHTASCEDREPCFEGVSAAPQASTGLAWAGGLDGRLRAYSADTGEIRWQYDTWGPQSAVNGVAEGGSIDVHGPVVANNMVFVTSGYAMFEQKGGNALFAFRLAP